MKVPLRWLQEFIDLPTTDPGELSYAFSMLGLTVEGVKELSAEWSGVCVGHVLEVRTHPNADRVRVCQVDTGNGPEQVVCGAWNFEAGALVPVANPGAVLPGGLEIGQRTIRGVGSHGMICSEAELGLSEDHGGIMVLDGTPSVGSAFADHVELPDVVFELDVTPNRPDALSMVGVARDLAAWFDIEYRVPEMDLATSPGATSLRVEIGDPAGCWRFTGREIRGVEMGRSPFWVRHRLHKAGMRAISNVVDVTSYVMFEMGHPLHAFDADSIEGGRLTVRRASEGETLVTLDGEERALDPDDLIIYDDAGPTSMSGTMGGLRSEVTNDTTNVLLEAASWNPPTIMHMWRRHDLRSEAATRFERGVDPNLADIANRRASAMVAALAGGRVLEGAIDEVAVQTDPVAIELFVSEVERLLGPGFSSSTIAGILRRLDLSVEGHDPLLVTVPTVRSDLTRPADLIEEIARIHGFDKFEATLPTGPSGGLTAEQTRARIVRSTLAGLGLYQAISLPFAGIEDLRAMDPSSDPKSLLTVKNPLRDEESTLRPSLLPGLLGALRYNTRHGASDVALFETGRVFGVDPSDEDHRLPAQTEYLAWAAVGATGMARLEGDSERYDGAASLGLWRVLAKKLDIAHFTLTPASPQGFHPGRTAAVELDGRVIGHAGELNPRAGRAFDLDGRIAVAELELDPILRPREPVQPVFPSVYPFVDFDLSFETAQNMAAQLLMDVTSEAAGGLLESARVFDEFRGLDGDRKAIAMSYRLRAPDRTLTNKEVAPVRQAMIDAAVSVGASLRGA